MNNIKWINRILSKGGLSFILLGFFALLNNNITGDETGNIMLFIMVMVGFTLFLSFDNQ